MKAFLRVYLEDQSYKTVPVHPNTTAREVCSMVLRKVKAKVGGLSGGPAAAPSFSLYVAQAMRADELFERRLEPEETPLALQEAVRRQGRLHHFRFILRDDADQKRAEDSGDDDGGVQAGSAAAALGKRAGVGDVERGGGVGGARRGGDAGGSGVGASPRRRMVSPKPTPTSPTPPRTSEKCGYLDKKGVRDHSFRRRWFVLQKGKLFYFANHRSNPRKPLSGIDCAQVAILGVEGRATFRLRVPDRSYELRAQTPAEAADWVACIKRHSLVNEENAEMDRIQALIDGTEKLVASSDVRRSERLLSLEWALDDADSRAFIHREMSRRHCEENLEFYFAVTDFERRFLHEAAELRRPRPGQAHPATRPRDNSMGPPQRPLRAVRSSFSDALERDYDAEAKIRSAEAAREAKRIFDTYIGVDAPRSVCPSHKVAADILTAIRGENVVVRGSPGSTCFSKLRKEVLANLDTQQFRRLAKTERYRHRLLAQPYTVTGLALERVFEVWGEEEKKVQPERVEDRTGSPWGLLGIPPGSSVAGMSVGAGLASGRGVLRRQLSFESIISGASYVNSF